MKKEWRYIILVVAVLVILVLVWNVGGVRGDKIDAALASYFEEKIITLGVEDIGQPIEGFDANLLILAFPGLENRDFSDVETLEGYYVVEGEEIIFKRDQGMPVTSAERMVSEMGYRTLLENLTQRLELPAKTEAEIDMIIERINTGEHVSAMINETASALNVKVTPLEVIEDSRCPIDVTCIQAGTVRVRATLESGLGEGSQIFELNQPITTEGEQVTLTRVEPTPESSEAIEDNRYVFYFEIRKR